LVLGRGPLPVPGATDGAVALDADGRTVLVVHLEGLEGGSSEALADELDRLAALDERDLGSLGTEPMSDLPGGHARLFGPSDKLQLNREQRIKVLVDREPSEREWKELIIETGGRLSGVYTTGDGAVTPLSPPESVTRRRTSEATAWSMTTWLSLGVVLLGVGIVLLAIWNVIDRDEPAPPPAQPLAQSSRAAAATGVPFDATSTNWIGQRRVVSGVEDRLLFAYRDDSGLQIVTDRSNRGRSWRSPVGVPGLTPGSFAIASSTPRRLGIAMIEDDAASFALLRQTEEGWNAESTIPLGGRAASAVVDIAWDPANRVFHIVWAVSAGGDEEILKWAAVQPSGGLVEERELTEAGNVPVLANVASNDRGAVLVTYRRPDSGSGWFSQLSQGNDIDGTLGFDWSPEETVPTPDGIGAASLAFDDAGFAHLALRDSTNFEIKYFRRNPQRGWSGPEVAASGGSIDEVDFPSVTTDSGSELVYVFFQSNETGIPEVRVAVRDPVDGWIGPFSVLPGGATTSPLSYPTSPDRVDGQPIVLWTTSGGVAEAARFTVP
jgi:hypothetical protein